MSKIKMDVFLKANGLAWRDDRGNKVAQQSHIGSEDKGTIYVKERNFFFGNEKLSELFKVLPVEIIELFSIDFLKLGTSNGEYTVSFFVKINYEDYLNFMESENLDAVKEKFLQGYNIKKTFDPEEAKRCVEKKLAGLSEEVRNAIKKEMDAKKKKFIKILKEEEKVCDKNKENGGV